MEMSLLRAEGVRLRYGSRLVVDVDELRVESGEIVAVLGPNGAGKSTLFRLLLLLERPEAGTVYLDGRAVRPGDREASRRMTGVFQRPYLFAGTVEENIAFGLRARRVRRRERESRVAQVLDLLGLAGLARVPAHALSGGEAQRVALGRALATSPDILLLDEPTANLDVTVRNRFREDLERLVRDQVRGALLITHDPADAFALADRVAVMEEGRIVQTASPETLILEPATPFVAAFTGAELILDGIVSGKEEDGLLAIEVGEDRSRLHPVPEPRGGAQPSGERRGPTRIVAMPPAGGSVPTAGAAVQVAYRPEDVLLAEPEGAARTSARNRFRVRVTAVTPAGGSVRIRLDGEVSLAALVSRGSVRALDLRPGREIEARIKATALRVFAATGRVSGSATPALPMSAADPSLPAAGRPVPSGG